MEGEERCYHDKAFSIKPKNRRKESRTWIHCEFLFNIIQHSKFEGFAKCIFDQVFLCILYYYISTYDVVVFIALHQRTLNLYIFEPSDGCTSSCIYSENLVEATQNQTEEEGILLLLLQAFTSTSTRILWQQQKKTELTRKKQYFSMWCFLIEQTKFKVHAAKSFKQKNNSLLHKC